ncbi:hypothetical protein AB0G49_31895, partial [Streptomyces longwoodensis]|uniref:hypothetical protein n=1 Tax=Streptomyces longwoodensis TaxID=68231 RepID=UPI0033CA19B8
MSVFSLWDAHTGCAGGCGDRPLGARRRRGPARARGLVPGRGSLIEYESFLRQELGEGTVERFHGQLAAQGLDPA